VKVSQIIDLHTISLFTGTKHHCQLEKLDEATNKPVGNVNSNFIQLAGEAKATEDNLRIV
jgi:hypothetical protein